MADGSTESRTLEEQERNGVRSGQATWAEQAEEASRGQRARSYFRENPRAKWILLLLVIVAAVVALYLWHYYSVRESTDDAQIDGHIVSVSARVGGTVINVKVNDNQYVAASAVLVQLDPKDYEVALQRAEAELADAQAAAQAARTGVPITTTSTSSGLDTARANLAAAQREVQAARARAREAEAHYTKAASDLNRMKQLISRDEVSRQQYDAALSAEAAARASVDAAQAMVATAESHVTQAQAQVAAAESGPQQVQVTRARASAAEANAQKLQAAVEQARLNLQYTTVRAPFAGIVSKRGVESGQVVQAGQPLISVVNLDDIWVTANFKETQLRDMRPSQAATIHVDTYGHDYSGHVDSIGGATGARFSLLPPENATGNYVKVVQRIPVKIVFDRGQDPQHLLRPGMSVVPTVMTK